MIKVEVDLEMLIKTYAKSQNPNGIFISILEEDDKLAEILNVSHEEMINLVYGYLYLFDFKNQNDMVEFYNQIKSECHQDSLYAVLVINGGIKEEYPTY